MEESNIISHSDKYILSIVIRNILDGANKNTKNGHVRLGARRSLDKIDIYVSDNGNGMSQETIDKFVQANRTNSDGGLSGVIILGMLQKIKGYIHIDSKVDRRTSYIITILSGDTT